MSILQLVSSFLVLSSTAWLAIRLSFRMGMSRLHVLVWAAFVMTCVASFVGVR